MELQRLGRELTDHGIRSTISWQRLCLGIGAAACLTMAAAEDYEIGGPLAGVRLPLFPTEHGEPAGYPGAIPELAAAAAAATAESTEFTTQGNNPVLELRPGSPELYMAYMDKYMPVRPMFDRQSLVQLWPASELGTTEDYAAPLYWVGRHSFGQIVPGKFWSPRPVVRATIDSGPLRLKTAVLARGMYCVKVVAAVPTDLLRVVRLPLYLSLTVTDQPDGGVTRYRYRAGYCDEFYSVAELYFHAVDARAFTLDLAVDAGSQVPLLIHCIELHDALAGIEVKAYKQRATLSSEASRQRLRLQYQGERTVKDVPNSSLIRAPADAEPMTREARWQRDAALWQAWLPLNAQPGGVYGRNQGYGPDTHFGAQGKTPAQLAELYGAWELVGDNRQITPESARVLLRNPKLDLEYTIADLIANRPLPDPYPIKDDGAGVYTSPEDGGGQAQHFSPIADALHGRATQYTQFLNWVAAPSYHYAGNEQLGRDAALMLIRLAYDWPAIDSANALSALVASPGGYGRDLHCRQRATSFYNWPWYTQYQDQVRHYDQLFDLIDGNEDLAASVQRFVPWIKSSQDIIALLDAYLLRTSAKRVLRYNWHTGEMKIALFAQVQDDRAMTDPWLEWLFTRTWVYPLPPSGIADLLVTGCDRNGPEYIASSYYAQGESALPKAQALEPYIAAGGNPAYSLSDASRFPKPVMMCYWPMDVSVTGRHFLRIGDVAGPDKPPGYRLDYAAAHFRQGWKWTHDPIFAWYLAHEHGRLDEDDAGWAEIERAAATVSRAPHLDNPSRAISQWASILESGRQYDDYRFRRAVSVRTGMGWGHHHNDSLDLQVQAHGLPMTLDGGQRPTYSKPADRSTRMHNLVEVDGLGDKDGQWLSHSWTRALADTEGAQYMCLEAMPPTNHPEVRSYRRQVALIDVDDGQGATPLTAEQMQTKAKLPTEVVTPNSYVVDVVRVAGGRRHTYCFHAALSDEVVSNAENVVVDPVAQDEESLKDRYYLSRMAGEISAGSAPDHFTCTWRMRRDNEGIGQGERGMLGPNYDQASPRKYTRLHLLGVAGQRVLRGSLDCVKWHYQIPMAFVQKRSPTESDPAAPADLESAYVGIIEPYVGEPFIEQVERLTVAAATDGAAQPVALAVTTTNGRRDIVYFDDNADVVREIRDGNQVWRVQAAYLYYSSDAAGVRQITMVGGALFETDGLRLTSATAVRTGQITAADYATKTITVSGQWPALVPQNRTFEVGLGRHWTTYTMTAVAATADAARITVRGGADFYLSRVKDVDEAEQTVYCVLGLAQDEGRVAPGLDRNWVASDEAGHKFWRAEYLGGDRALGRYGFKLDGPVKLADFGRSGGFRMWEYGVGDTVRQCTSINIRRGDDGVLVAAADVAGEVSINGVPHQLAPGVTSRCD